MLVARTMCAVTLIQGKNSNPFNVDIPLIIVCVTSNWHIHNSSRKIIICVTRWTDVITDNMYNINNGDKNRGSWVFVCASLSNWNWNGKQMGMCEHVIFNWSAFLKDHHQCVSIYFWIFLIWNDGWPNTNQHLFRDIHFEAHIVWNGIPQCSLQVRVCVMSVIVRLHLVNWQAKTNDSNRKTTYFHNCWHGTHLDFISKNLKNKRSRRRRENTRTHGWSLIILIERYQNGSRDDPCWYPVDGFGCCCVVFAIYPGCRRHSVDGFVDGCNLWHWIIAGDRLVVLFTFLVWTK